jgi:hypothetical protein
MAQVSKTFSQSAPVKGINAFDSIAAMPEGSALLLRNLYAQPYGCQIRRGYVRHATGLPGDVESLMSHNIATPQLYAACGNAIYNVTEANNPAGIPGLTTLNNRWQHINFPNPAGVNMVAVNGSDPMLWFKPDGMTIVEVIEGDGTADTIKGIDPTKFIHVCCHQKRLWFVEEDSLNGWYMPPDQITGEAKLFNFGPLFSRGGYLMQIITWTIDDGNGSDDHLAAITSEGEVAIYQGTDPNAEGQWSLQGVYYAGAPLGRRGATKYGGDILMLTQFGVVQLSDLLKSTKVNPTESNMGQWVQQIISALASQLGNEFGWQPFIFPGLNMIIINIPVSPSHSVQYVMNDITKAWSQFDGFNAFCWELFEQYPCYGSGNAVYRALEGNTDDALLDENGKVVIKGNAIRAEAQTAFSYFSAMGVNKHFKLVRPVIMSEGKFKLSVAVNVNYSLKTTVSPASVDFYDPGHWDDGKWDIAVWAGGMEAFQQWLGIVGLGVTGSLRILFESDSETFWVSTDWLYEVGGVM